MKHSPLAPNELELRHTVLGGASASSADARRISRARTNTTLRDAPPVDVQREAPFTTTSFDATRKSPFARALHAKDIRGAGQL